MLKETVLNYTHYETDVYACFVDISKAFDSVNHSLLMNKVIDYGIPELFVNFFVVMYDSQLVKVKYLSQFSKEWMVKNGVRQGGILSGLFFF